MYKHKHMNTPDSFKQAVQRLISETKTEFEFHLDPIVKHGQVVGTKGHILNPDNGNCVYVESDQYSPYLLQIEYRYVRDLQDKDGGGLNRRGDYPERIASEIVRMLCETDRKKVALELSFKRKLYA